MNFFQTSPDRPLPKTALPSLLRTGVLSSVPTQTADAICGVYPTIQAAQLSDFLVLPGTSEQPCVPVLPAQIRPSAHLSFALLPTTGISDSVTLRAICALLAASDLLKAGSPAWVWSSRLSTTLLSLFGSMTLDTTCGVRFTPLAAKVAYAPAMSIGRAW